MDVAPFIESFRRLKTNDLRRTALQDLLRELSPYEWRAVCSATAQRSFDFDIVGRLPVELVAHIFSYLDTSSPFRLQRVSRQWRDVLQSDVIIKAGLASWFNGRVTTQDADYSECVQRAKKIHGFRHGQPDSLYKLVTPGTGPYASFLTDNLYIWQPRSSFGRCRAIFVLDLHNWILHTLCGAAREEIYAFTASNQIVAIATYGNICYVWDLYSNAERKTFSVPNIGFFSSMAARDRTVICARLTGDDYEVYIWEYESQLGKSITVRPANEPGNSVHAKPSPHHKHTLVILPQPQRKTFVVFADTNCAVEGCLRKVIWSVFSYEGECYAVTRPCDPKFPHFYFLPRISSFISTGEPYNFRIRVHVRTADGSDREIKTLRFDERTNNFTLIGPQTSCAHMDSNGEGRHHERDLAEHNCRECHTLVTGGTTAWWKDTFYVSETGPADNTVLACKLDHKESRLVISDPYVQRGAARPVDAIVMNERYVIRNYTDDIYICCFEESEHRPKTGGKVLDGIGQLEILEKQ